MPHHKTRTSRLMHKVFFLQNVQNNESEDEKWEEVIEAFAEVNPICDNRFIAIEGLQFGHVISEDYYLFKIRYTENLDINMRIKFKDRIFEIKRILNIRERCKMLHIIALQIRD